MIEKHGGDAATTELIRRMKLREQQQAKAELAEREREERLKALPPDLPPGERGLIDPPS